ncbi:MAG: glycosyltransferase family 4 protein [Bacteroidota bacterium]
MKHICFFNSMRFWGGGEKLHLEYALAFLERGYQVTLLCDKGSPLAEKARNTGLILSFLSVKNLSFLNAFKVRKVASFFQEREIDTVIFSSSQDTKLASLAAEKAGLDRVVYLRGLAVPVKGSYINKRVFSSILTHIVANSEETKRRLLQNLTDPEIEKKVSVVYHGIETKDFLTHKPHTLPAIKENAQGVILGNAGRLTEQKGQLYLIELAKRLKAKGVDFTLFIAGTGELQEKLEEQITIHGLEKEVILLGFVEDMKSFMQSLDVFILSSMWEGFGYVLVEAMIARKAVLAFDVSSNPEIVSQNETGFLVPPTDMDQFTAKAVKLIEDTDLRISMGKAGKQRVLDKFELSERITEFEQVLLGNPA